MNFQKNIPLLKEQIIKQHQGLIEKERLTLSAELEKLEGTIKANRTELESILRKEAEKLHDNLDKLSKLTDTNVLRRSFFQLKKLYYKKKVQKLDENINRKLDTAVADLVEIQRLKTRRHDFINSQFMDAVHESASISLADLDRKQRVIEQVNTSIYGAIGEHKVVKELEKLSDENILINDFSITFQTPIYNRQEKDLIKSIQIDHLLINRSGVFLIETKNWSEESLMKLNLRSPVQQVKRTSYALFKIIANGNIGLDPHHWGEKKIPIRNVIVLTNSRPIEEFQYVKVLSLNELLRYIQYFPPIFLGFETERIADYLLRQTNAAIPTSLRFRAAQN